MKRLILFAAMMISLGAQAQKLILQQGVENLTEIDFFLAASGYNAVSCGSKLSGNQMCSKLANPKTKAGYVKIIGQYDKDMKVTAATITGTPDDLIYLFLNYWESDISVNQLKQKGYVHQDNGGDRITFDWKGKDPVIKIIKNPDSPTVTFN